MVANVLSRTLTYQKKDGVLIIRIFPINDRQGVAQLSNALIDLCKEILLDKDIRVIVLTGTEVSSFMIEPTLLELGSDDSAEPESGNVSIAGCVAGLDVPVIAAIHGDVIGRGFEFVLACDIRIAADTANFALTHVNAGVVPWDGGTQRLCRLVGKSKAMEMILTGKRIDAREALRIGLVNTIVPREEVTAAVMEMAFTMAEKGPIALRYAKEAVLSGMDMTMEQGLCLEADLYLLLHTTRDRAEGIKAFLNKRDCSFEGK